MKCNFLKTVLILIFGMSMTSCSWFEDDHSEAAYELVSISQKSPVADFSQYSTFAVAKEMNYITDDKKERKETEDSQRFRAIIIENMKALGYKLIEDDSTNPDLAIDLSFLKTSTTTYYPGYWWGWDSWYWWGGGYYPYYPYYPYMPSTVSSYSSGVLMMEMAALKGLGEDDKLPIVWQGLVRGVLSSMISNADQERAIDKCFEIMPPINSK